MCFTVGRQGAMPRNAKSHTARMGSSPLSDLKKAKAKVKLKVKTKLQAKQLRLEKCWEDWACHRRRHRGGRLSQPAWSAGAMVAAVFFEPTRAVKPKTVDPNRNDLQVSTPAFAQRARLPEDHSGCSSDSGPMKGSGRPANKSEEG